MLGSKENSNMPVNDVVASTTVSPSARPGMGTILFPGGAAFRVWAPFASAVSVSGEFNQWMSSVSPLESEGNGYWYGEVAGARIGQQYEFVIAHEGHLLPGRKDP